MAPHDRAPQGQRAARQRHPGPYQLQAALAHAEAPSWEATDWEEVVGLYDALLAVPPSPVVRLDRAIALRGLRGPEAALREVEALGAELERYPYFHAARGKLLREAGRAAEARAADARALELTTNPAERELLLARLA